MVAHARDARPRKQIIPEKKQVATALISVAGTVLVAFIGVLPRYQGKTPEAHRLSIAGAALDSTTMQPLGWKDVFLIPSSNNPQLIGQTDGAGGFKFPDVPDQQYWIVVRDSESGTSGGGHIDQNHGEAKFNGTLIRYSVNAKSSP